MLLEISPKYWKLQLALNYLIQHHVHLLLKITTRCWVLPLALVISRNVIQAAFQSLSNDNRILPLVLTIL